MKLNLLFILLMLSYNSFGQIEEVYQFEDINRLNPRLQFKFGERLFFGTGFPETLWISDGTKEGTKKINGIPTIDNYYLFEDRCFLTNSNDLYEINSTNYEIELVTSLNAEISRVLALKDELVVISRMPTLTAPTYIEIVDPINGNSELIFEIDDNFDEVVSFDDKLLCSYASNLLVSDGTEGGTMTILDGNSSGVKEIKLSNGISLDGRYIFQAKTELEGSELWITDGTVNETKLVKDINTDISDNGNAYGSIPSKFFRIDNEIYFIGKAIGNDLSLFKTNGTKSGTELVFSFEGEFDIYQIIDLFTFKDEVFFRAITLASGDEIWKTDGTEEGTALLKDIWEGSGSSSEAYVSSYRKFSDEFIYFHANDGVFGHELWRSDGTEEGTQIVADFAPGADWSSIYPLVGIDGQFYFIEDCRNKGFSLSKIDESISLSGVSSYPTSYDWFETIGHNPNQSQSVPVLSNYEMEIDQLDNVYLQGRFSDYHLQFYGSDDFIVAASTAEGPYRNFLSSYDKNGSFRWAKEIGGDGFSRENSMATDAESNVVVAGVYFREGVIGDVEMKESDNRYFLAKLSKDGEFVWKKNGNIGKGANSEVNKVETDSAGNIFVSGCFTDFKAEFGSHQITAPISPAFFTAKYDKDGNELWLKYLPYPSVQLHGEVKSVQEFDGKLYVIISDGGYNWNSSCEFRSWDLQFYVLDQNGEILIDKRLSSSDFTFITDAKFSDSGYLHVIGMFRGDFEIEGVLLSTACEDSRGFVIKMDDELEIVESFSLDTPSTFLQEIELAADDSYYLSGRQVLESVEEYSFNYFRNLRNKTFVKKYDKHNKLIDVRNFSKFHSDFFDSKPLISIDGEEKLILSERYDSSFDTFPIHGTGNKIGLMKFSLDGKAIYPADDILDNVDVMLFPNPAKSVVLKSEDEDFRHATFKIYTVGGQLISIPSSSYDKSWHNQDRCFEYSVSYVFPSN